MRQFPPCWAAVAFLWSGCTPAPSETTAAPRSFAPVSAQSAASSKPPLATATLTVASDAGYSPELVSFKSGALTLGGWIWRPRGAGPFPAIVFNHGSEEYPGAKDGQAMFFVPRGFVLFVPHRRGQGRSKHAGRYIDEFYDAAAHESSAFVDALVRQNDDVMAAVAYAASLPHVDPKRIAVSGCSLGGIESLLAAERGTGIVAAVDFAGAAMTWSTNTPLQERMKSAARNAKVPVFFVQAQNDYDTTPSLVLSALMKSAGKPVRVHVFPANGTTHEQGHAFCHGGSDPVWGEEVLAFLRDAMTPS
jgi:dipeptidyl aminopeptidase/acylaminoacyl peptidase